MTTINDCVLIVVAKQPAPGNTKTRLCPPLNYEQAAELYECFLRDTLEVMRKVPGVRRWIGYLPEGGERYFNQLAPDMELIFQHGETLGERLDHLLTQALQNGAGRAVVMDSDSPNLPAEYLSLAFEKLQENDVVLGPTCDGGYYLIGMKKPHPHLLKEVQMSTSHVLADTLTLAAKNHVKAALLPEWYDVDTFAELSQLHADLTNGGQDVIADHTRRWLAANGSIGR